MQKSKIWKVVELLTAGGVLTVAGVLINFYIQWQTDEQLEQGQMFDTETQKAKVIQHIESIPTVDLQVKIQRDMDFQKKVLDELDHIMETQAAQDSINQRTHDQIYQNNQRLKDLIPNQ